MPRTRAAAAAGCAVAVLCPALAAAQARVEPGLAAAAAAAPRDSLLPVLVVWAPPSPAQPAGGGLGAAAAESPRAVRRRLESALAERHARGRAALAARGLDAGSEVRDERHLWIAGATAARATPAAIAALAEIPDVEAILSDAPFPVSGLEPAVGAGTLPPSYVPWGLDAVGAPLAWQAGFTGRGRLVGFIDSGVDGRHPLLRARWRGRSRSPREAWFDPFGRSAEPVDDVGHGTVVATVAVGALAPGDTLVDGRDTLVAAGPLDVVTGVAPEAEWVAANAFEVFAGQAYTRRSILLQAMQWMLDPDGDPETADDVPDVVNNSWGEVPADSSEFCTGVYHRAIDALERAGVAVVFAAGNRSGGLQAVLPPGNRADLLANAFAVGAVQPAGDSVVVSDFSLGGPSPCGAVTSVKPEIVAPGFVPSAVRTGDRTARVVGSAAGTSFAAPHAAGALALLREADPAVASDMAKRALLETARDLYPPGPDQRAGFGLLDVPAALERVGARLPALLRLAGWESAAGGLTVTVQNVGREAWPAGTAELRSRPDGASLGGPRPLGPVAPGDTARLGPYPFDVAAAPGARLELVARAAGRAVRLPFVAHPRDAGAAGPVVLRDGPAAFALDGAGRYGRVAGGPGLEAGGADALVAGALVVWSGDRISDAIYEDVQSRFGAKASVAATATDWRLRARTLVEPATVRHAYDDRDALRPVGVAVEETARLAARGDSAAYVVLEFRAQAPGARRLFVGLFADFDAAAADTVYWDDGLAALVTRPAAGGTGAWSAVALAGAPAVAVALPLGRRDFALGLYLAGTGVLADPFEDPRKLALLTGGAPARSHGRADDWAAALAAGPLEPRRDGSLPPVTFVLATGTGAAALADALAAARASASAPAAPEGRALVARPPFPNPFDPLRQAVVRFPFDVGPALRSPGAEAVFEIFGVSGRPVYRARMPVGDGAPLRPFEWDGRGADGEPVASGVYLYRIRVGAAVARGTFLLLK